MVEKVAWNLNIYIEKGPSMNVADSLNIDAYDKISVTIPKGATDRKIDVQPSGAGKIIFLAIESDDYGQRSKRLIYKSGNGVREITLDRAHVLVGGSLVELLALPNTLTFTNNTTKDVTVKILVGRSAMNPVIMASCGSGGSINPEGKVEVTKGANQIFTITASNGHHISDVLVDNSSVGAVPTYEFLEVTEDHDIKAEFEVDQ